MTRLARFQPGRANHAVQEPAPQSAAYKVKYGSASGGLKSAGGTKRIVGRGEPLGFSVAADGTVIAVAGGEEIPLDTLPSATRYCVWTTRDRRPTQFAREVAKAVDTAGQAALTGGAVVGIAALHVATHPPEPPDCDNGKRRRRK